MRQPLCAHRTYGKRDTRIKKRSPVVLALTVAGAFGVVICFPASSAADPPPCNPGSSATDNKSCVNFQVLPTNPHATLTSASLFLHTHTNFAHPADQAQGGRIKTLTLYLDDDFVITPGTIPTCSGSQVAGKTIAQVWATCGPGAGPTHNAYLSPGTGVSGRSSTVPPYNFPGCTLLFNGPAMSGLPTVTVYSRLTYVPNGTANCSSPAINNSGNVGIVFVGTILNAGVPGFGKRFVAPNLDTVPSPGWVQDDFTALVKRGNYFRAKCPAGHSPWRVRGVFKYSGTGQATDTWPTTQPCS